MEYRISVIMGIYNCASTLEEALDSLMAQTYQGFKVIMCDDGSTDNTLQVAQDYAARYPGRFLVIRNEKNIKLAATLNHCLQYVDTEYVARMDGDDISMPTRFEKQIEFLDTHPEFGFVSSAMIYFDENGDFRTGTVTPEPTRETFRRSTPYCHAPVLMRDSSYKAVGGYTVDSRTVRMEDVDLWYKLTMKGIQGYNFSEPLYKMRDARDARSRRSSLKARWKTEKQVMRIHRGLGLSWPWLYPTVHYMLWACSQLLPYRLYQFLRVRFNKGKI